MTLQRTIFTVWHNADLLDVDSMKELFIQFDGVEYVHLDAQEDSAAVYDDDRGTYVVPTEEICPPFERDIAGIITTLADLADDNELSQRQQELIDIARTARDQQ